MDAIAFDIDGFKRAFEAGEPEKILQFYSPDLEHVEIDQDAPPASQRTTGFDEISQAFEGIAQAGMPLRMDNVVDGGDRAACTITVEFPDRRRLLSNTIFDLKDGKIVRQLDIQVSDPEGA
jgi:hypothetical protein